MRKKERFVFGKRTFRSQKSKHFVLRIIDFTTIIHDDEKHLAKLIERGIDDDDFRKKILNHTKIWEENNDKSMQFLFYDAMCRKVSTKI